MGPAVDASVQNGTLWLFNDDIWVRSGTQNRNLSLLTPVVANPAGL